MKAAVLEALDKISLKETAVPEIDAESILVRVKACSVCGSDIRIFHSGNSRVKPPVVIGHEVAGEIAKVGKNVKNFKAGDKIALGADVPCGECDFCKNGLGNNCAVNYAIGYQFPGGFAEYMVLNETTVKYGPVNKIPEGVSFEEASLAEPLACCINATERSRIELGDTVLIIGAGPAGIMLLQLAKILGAAKVIISQRSKHRLEQAKKFNPDVAIEGTGEELIKQVLKATNGAGPDVIFTACPSNEAQQDAIKLVKQRGRVNFFGGLAKGKSEITIDSNLIHYKECNVSGSHGSVPRQHKLALELIAAKKINVKDLISHRFKLAEIDKAFQAAEQHNGMKVIVEC